MKNINIIVIIVIINSIYATNITNNVTENTGFPSDWNISTFKLKHGTTHYTNFTDIITLIIFDIPTSIGIYVINRDEVIERYKDKINISYDRYNTVVALININSSDTGLYVYYCKDGYVLREYIFVETDLSICKTTSSDIVVSNTIISYDKYYITIIVLLSIIIALMISAYIIYRYLKKYPIIDYRLFVEYH